MRINDDVHELISIRRSQEFMVKGLEISDLKVIQEDTNDRRSAGKIEVLWTLGVFFKYCVLQRGRIQSYSCSYVHLTYEEWL